jgi:hypothetical protein
MQLLETCWRTGRQIAPFKQDKDRAEYGAALMNRLSANLHLRHGKRFNRGNVCKLPISGT